MTVAPRQIILENAISHTCKARNETYGSPVRNLGDTADLWTAYLRTKYFSKVPGFAQLRGEFILTAEDVAWLNVLQKMSRSVAGYHQDNYEDAAAYAAIAGECALYEEELPNDE